jgi:hypothetical protein
MRWLFELLLYYHDPFSRSAAGKFRFKPCCMGDSVFGPKLQLTGKARQLDASSPTSTTKLDGSHQGPTTVIWTLWVLGMRTA